jgi:hypothetical protein
MTGFLYTDVAQGPGLPGRRGAIAQLVERLHGMQEARGSSPLSSTQNARSGHRPGSVQAV